MRIWEMIEKLENNATRRFIFEDVDTGESKIVRIDLEAAPFNLLIEDEFGFVETFPVNGATVAAEYVEIESEGEDPYVEDDTDWMKVLLDMLVSD